MSVRARYGNFIQAKVKFEPLFGVDRYGFYDNGEKQTANVDWIDPGYIPESFPSMYRFMYTATLYEYIFRSACQNSCGLRRGDRIDVSIALLHLEAYPKLLKRWLHRIPSRYGVQFVSFLDQGVAFVKL